jgi:hypothetical protein
MNEAELKNVVNEYLKKTPSNLLMLDKNKKEKPSRE